ncbi:MAG: primosomal protein N' [Patescibacteria group bacterium]
MYIVTVFPIARNAFKDRLSYWSAHPFRPGSIITVPVRGREIAALVETVQPAQQAKTSVKNAEFMTKKIDKGDERMLVRPGCIRAAIKTATYFISPFGQTLRSLIPESILSAPLEVVKEISDKERAESTAPIKLVDDDGNDIVPEVLTFQTNDADRYSSYKSIVREEFARKRSVLMIVPTVVTADNMAAILRKGIDDYVVVLHSGLSKKKQRAEWVRAVTDEHPLLVIATPNFMSVPRRDVHTIIVEKESSRAYLAARPPFVDARAHAEYYAREIGARIIYGDSLLRVETLHRRETGEVTDLFSPSFRIENNPKTLVVDMSDSVHKATKENKNSPIMSEELESMIQYAIDKKSRIFIYSARRGLAPQTVCGDCSQTVLCDQCQAPVVLHQSKSETERFFLCHHCGKKRSAAERCVKCNSWKLITLGVGIDTVIQEIEKQFPKAKIFKIDRDSVSTDKQARMIINEFEKTPGSILVGTETTLAFLPSVPYIAVASLDSLFSLPDFRLNERICHTLLRLISSTTEYFLIQTRNPSAPILDQITRGALTDFYRKEIEMRQMLQYPPFSTFIKVTIEGKKAVISEQMERVQAMLEPWSTSVFPAFIPTIKGNSVLHLLVTVPPESWPDEGLAKTLSSLQPNFVVKVNPESLL